MARLTEFDLLSHGRFIFLKVPAREDVMNRFVRPFLTLRADDVSLLVLSLSHAVASMNSSPTKKMVRYVIAMK